MDFLSVVGLLAIIAAVGGLLYWKRDTIKSWFPKKQ
jgi:hypothetical protein